jgi:hypothetical protein
MMHEFSPLIVGIDASENVMNAINNVSCPLEELVFLFIAPED